MVLDRFSPVVISCNIEQKETRYNSILVLVL